MAIFDVGFVFSCRCFFSDVQHARSTKNYEIGVYVNGKHIVTNENERMKNLFLSAVLIIL